MTRVAEPGAGNHGDERPAGERKRVHTGEREDTARAKWCMNIRGVEWATWACVVYDMCIVKDSFYNSLDNLISGKGLAYGTP